MLDTFRGFAIASLDLGIEESLELIVEYNTKVLCKDVIIVAVADYNTEGIGGADTLNNITFLLTDLGFSSASSPFYWVNLLWVTY